MCRSPVIVISKQVRIQAVWALGNLLVQILPERLKSIHNSVDMDVNTRINENGVLGGNSNKEWMSMFNICRGLLEVRDWLA